MNQKTKLIVILVGGLLILFGILFALMQIKPKEEPPAPAPPPRVVTPTPAFVSPIDFEALQAENSDIYAWLEIPNTEMNYPILQHPTGEEYYLSTDRYHNYYEDGELFTQHTYNGLDFEDPVTVVYGHNLVYGGRFTPLPEIYSSLEGMKANNIVNVYLPTETKVYQIFAGIPYSDIHLLYYNDFNNPHVFDDFLEEIKNARGFGATVDNSIAVTNQDNLIILSTCIGVGGSDRFLVIGVEKTKEGGN